MAQQRKLDEAIDTCSWDNIQRCIVNPDTAMDVSHRLVHVVATGGPLHNSYVTKMASLYVVDKLAERAGVAHVQHLRELLMATLAESPYDSAAGSFFEHFAHRAVQAGGAFKASTLLQYGHPA